MATASVTRRRTQTRERLITAAVDLFAERGVLGASVEEICERADFTRGAFYSNFADKDELCVAVIDRFCSRELTATAEVVDNIAERMEEAQTLAQLISWAVDLFLASQYRTDTELIAAEELRLHALRSPQLRTSFLRLSESVDREFTGLLTAAVERVGARLLLPVDQAIDLLYAVYTHSGITAILNGRRLDDDSRKQLLAAVLGAATTDQPLPAP